MVVTAEKAPLIRLSGVTLNYGDTVVVERVRPRFRPAQNHLRPQRCWKNYDSQGHSGTFKAGRR